MKIKTELDIEVSAKAIFREGKVQVSLAAASPYGNRKAQVSLDEGFTKEQLAGFEKLFQALIEANKDKLLAKLEAGRSEAITVAARMGEI